MSGQKAGRLSETATLKKIQELPVSKSINKIKNCNRLKPFSHSIFKSMIYYSQKQTNMLKDARETICYFEN